MDKLPPQERIRLNTERIEHLKKDAAGDILYRVEQIMIAQKALDRARKELEK